AKDTKQRYQTADEMVADLAAALSAADRLTRVEPAAQTTTALSPPVVPMPPATRRWSNGTLWSTVIGALAGLAVLALVLGLPSPRQSTTTVEPDHQPPEVTVQPVALTQSEVPKPVVVVAQASTAEKDDLAAAAHAVLKQHCYQCHGLADVNAGLHVLK